LIVANTQGIRAGRAYVELGVNDKISAGLRAAQRRLQAFGTALAGVGIGMLTPMIGAAKIFADFGSELHDAAGRTGMTVEALSELGYAAKMTGTDLATVETGIRRMQKTLSAARDGSTEASQALAKLGVSAARIANLTPEKQFEAIAQGLQGISDPTERAAAAMSVFGKGGTALLPMIADLEALRQKARDLGLTMTTEQASAADELGDSYDTLKASVRGLAVSVGSALAPALQKVTDALTRALSAISRFVRQHQAAVVAAAKLAVVLIGVGGAIVGLGASLGIVASSLKVIPAIFGGMVTVLGSLLSPMGLAIAAIATLGTVLVVASGQGGEALRWLGEQFQNLKGFASRSVGAISDALTAGDISLAAKVLWTSLKLAWQEGVNTLNEQWAKFKNSFLALATDAFYGAVALAAEAFYGLQKLWLETISFLASKWARFSGDFRELWAIAQNEVTKGLVKLMALFDERIDVNYATKIADNELSDKLAAIERETQGSIDTTEKSRKDKRASIEQERIGTLSAINDEADAAQRSREQQYGQEIDATKAALAQAKADWQAAVAQANAKAGQQDGKAGDSLADRLKRAMANASDAITDIRGRNMDVTGTFNAMASFGLGSQTSQERTAKATEETARNTNRIIQKMAGGQAFA
jgi:hypothetical protein